MIEPLPVAISDFWKDKDSCLPELKKKSTPLKIKRGNNFFPFNKNIHVTSFTI